MLLLPYLSGYVLYQSVSLRSYLICPFSGASDLPAYLTYIHMWCSLAYVVVLTFSLPPNFLEDFLGVDGVSTFLGLLELILECE